MFVSGWKWKTRKIIIPSPVPSYEFLMSVKENTDRKIKKNRKERKKKIKLNAPHVTYNVKMLPKLLTIPDK